MSQESEILLEARFVKEKVMSNPDIHATGLTVRQKVFMLGLFILSLTVSALVLLYFSPSGTTSSLTAAPVVQRSQQMELKRA